jgi:SNF2 family DNA or RNA helicase
VLIVAPKPVIGSWKEKFHFTPELRMLVLTGADRAGRFDQIPEADIVFANYNTLRIDVETLVQHRYSLIVFDEAQNLKSHNTVSHVVAARLQADQVVMVSGRPIENHLAELHSQVSLALPGLLGDAREFTRVYRTPIEKRADSEAKQRLRERIAPFILHRTKDEVADSLPPKSVVLKTVSMTPKQRQLYNAIMLTMNQRVWDAVAEKGIASSGIVILDALRKLQQICCHPALMKDEAGEGCQESAKFDYLLEQIEELVEEGRRMLVFSQHVEYLKLIQAALVARGITPLIFTGKTRDQDSVREAFQTGQHPVMLVSLKAGGSGMDFTAADTVLFASPWWNPAAEDQAMDRVHRIGQTKPVFVYKYIVENSIEGSIIQMQEKKAELARSILDDEAGATPPLFEIADIVDLFGERGAASINTDDTIEGEWSEVVPATAPALPSPHRVQATAPVMEAPSDAGDRARVVDWVRGALFEADLSVAEMNRRLGLRNKWLSNRISGMSLLPPSILVRLATQLERPVPPDILSAACAAWGPPDPDLHGALTANQRRVSDR